MGYKKFTAEEFIARAEARHDKGRYDYSKVAYVNSVTNVIIKCNVCGNEFPQIANSHLQGQGCPHCAGNVRMTAEEFIKRANEVHHGYYSYDKVKYVNSSTKVIVTCPVHGDFEQRPSSHLKGCGCWPCYHKRTSERLQYTKDIFVEKARAVHGDKYIYDKVDYKKAYEKVTITCPIHGDFEQRPSEHLLGKGCEKCGIESRAALATKDTEWFIRRAKEIHGDKYTYEHSVYKGSKEPIIITCPIHGDWETTPNTFLDDHGCPYCKGDAERERLLAGKASRISPEQTKTTEEFIADAIALHGDRYDYSKVNYIDSKKKVIIICQEHGEFETTPNEHLSGRGCPRCNASFGERSVELYLQRNNIKYKYQKKMFYDENGEKRHFVVDFWLPKVRTVIEYNGEQHYMPLKMWGGEPKFKEQQERDQHLREYCEENAYRLIEIPYTKLRHIPEFLDDALK